MCCRKGRIEGGWCFMRGKKAKLRKKGVKNMSDCSPLPSKKPLRLGVFKWSFGTVWTCFNWRFSVQDFCSKQWVMAVMTWGDKFGDENLGYFLTQLWSNSILCLPLKEFKDPSQKQAKESQVKSSWPKDVVSKTVWRGDGWRLAQQTHLKARPVTWSSYKTWVCGKMKSEILQTLLKKLNSLRL